MIAQWEIPTANGGVFLLGKSSNYEIFPHFSSKINKLCLIATGYTTASESRITVEAGERGASALGILGNSVIV